MAMRGFWAWVIRLALHVLSHAVFLGRLPYSLACQATGVASVLGKPKNRIRKENMNNFSKVAVVTAALALIAQGAKASVNEDLVLGFSDPSASLDYVIDLGQPTVVGVNSGSTVNLSGDISASTFNTDFGTAVNSVSAGVVGGSTSTTTGVVYMTTTRSGAPDNTAGSGSLNPLQTSQAAGFNMSASTAKNIGNHAEGVGAAVGSPVNPSNTDPASWTQNVVNYAGQQSSFSPQTGLSSSGAVYEDLWSAPNNNDSSWKYLGYFTFNFSSEGNPDVTFTAVAVPEPATYGFLAGAGLLVVALRRQLGHKAA